MYIWMSYGLFTCTIHVFFSSEIKLGARIFRSPIEFNLQDCLRISSILLLLFYIYLSLNKTPIYKTLKLKSYSYHTYYIFLWPTKTKLEIFGGKGHFSNIAKIQSELHISCSRCTLHLCFPWIRVRDMYLCMYSVNDLACIQFYKVSSPIKGKLHFKTPSKEIK